MIVLEQIENEKRSELLRDCLKHFMLAEQCAFLFNAAHPCNEIYVIFRLEPVHIIFVVSPICYTNAWLVYYQMRKEKNFGNLDVRSKIVQTSLKTFRKAVLHEV